MKIITNNNEREFIYGYDVPESVLDDYDHLDACEQNDHWIRYRNTYYHVSDFMRIDDHAAWDNVQDWCGYTSDSFFSGVLISLSDDTETYKIATYIS